MATRSVLGSIAVESNRHRSSAVHGTSATKSQVWARLRPAGGSLFAPGTAPIALVADKFVCGRKASANLVLDSNLVSGTHFRVKRSASGRHMLRDESTNGVFLNGNLVGKGSTAQLRDGDKISLPKSLGHFVVELVDHATAPAAAGSQPRQRRHSAGSGGASGSGSKSKSSKSGNGVAYGVALRGVEDATEVAETSVARPGASTPFPPAVEDDSAVQPQDSGGVGSAGSSLVVEEAYAQQLAPEALVGRRLLIENSGMGTVIDFKRGVFLGLGPSSHLVQLDNDCCPGGAAELATELATEGEGGTPTTTLQGDWLLLRRNGNGGLRFLVLRGAALGKGQISQRHPFADALNCPVPPAAAMAATAVAAAAQEEQAEPTSNDMTVIMVQPSSDAPTIVAQPSFLESVWGHLFGAAPTQSQDASGYSAPAPPATPARLLGVQQRVTIKSPTLQMLESQHDREAMVMHSECQRQMLKAMQQRLTKARGLTLASLLNHTAKVQRLEALQRWKAAHWHGKVQDEVKGVTKKYEDAMKAAKGSTSHHTTPVPAALRLNTKTPNFVGTPTDLLTGMF